MTVPSVPATVVSTASTNRRALEELAVLSERDVNFQPVPWDVASADPSWRIDVRSGPMPGEEPGSPVPGGSFLTARRALIDYEFADPRLVRAVYDAALPLEGRNMLLVGRFLGLRFHMGVRIGGVVDRAGAVDGRPVHRFAWHYRTLEGHLEQGQMDYELIKWTDSGEVRFRIRAYSRRAPIANPLVRLGFMAFGRREQLRFHRRSFDRLRCYIDEHATTPGATGPSAGQSP